jgi:methyltransferase (TIGR00027 family)
VRLPLLPTELHSSDRPSSTAQWTTLGRALERQRHPDERIVDDPFASYFLSTPTRLVWTALRAGGWPVQQAERLRVASIATSSLCRHRFIDTQLLHALPTVEQVLILGAGYDARAYRFRRLIGTRAVYEVDLPPTSRRKAAIVAAHPDVFEHSPVQRVEIDFRTQSLTDVLAASGFVASAPTFVSWEGVAMYLSRAAVAETLATLAQLCGVGSLLAMDCWRHVAGLGPYDQLRRIGERAIRLVGEPITFTASPEALGDLLAEHGFRVAEVATSEVLDREFATGGRRCDEGLYVLAAERR